MNAVNPVRLNHAVLFVADLDRAVRFYTKVFGVAVVTTEPQANAAFLRLPRSGNHHDLGLFGVGPHAAPKRRGGIGLCLGVGIPVRRPVGARAADAHDGSATGGVSTGTPTRSR